MNRNLTDMANEAFPAGPDRVALYPAAGQQRVLSALQQDVAAGQHVLYVTGPAGSGKTVLLRALLPSLEQGLLELIEKPTRGKVLMDVARALHLDAADGDETILRRQLVMMLSMIQKQHIPIIQIIDDADSLSDDDLNLLLHFFPSGHATLILAGVELPQAWQAGDAASPGSVPVVHSYRIDPLSADETAGYIHHRLRAASLSDDLLTPDTIAAIHDKSAGLPGAINRYCAETIAQADERMEDKVAAPEPVAAEPVTAEPATAESATAELAAASAMEADRHALWLTLDDDIVLDAITTPVRRRGQRNASSPSPLEITHESDAVARQVRRLRRRARGWRTAAVLAGVTLVAVLTKDAWIDRIPFSHPLLVSLTERFPGLSTAEHSVDESNQSNASSSPAKPAGSQESAVVKQNSASAPTQSPSTMTDTNNTGPPLSQAITPPSPAPAQHSSPEPSSAAVPMNNAPHVRNRLGATTDTTPPQSAPPESKSAETAPSPSTLPESKGAVSPPSLESNTAETAPPESTPPTSKHAEAKRAESKPAGAASETPSLTRAQRNEVGRLYAERAEYERGNGDLGAAAISIERGLASDPGNQRLLQMRAELADVPRAPTGAQRGEAERLNPETRPLTRAQRRNVARLYAERAEQEWNNGELGAAAVSIERGLASDPHNPILLRMRAQLPDVLRGP